MPKYIILNTVKSDGRGDFSHLEDIIKSINANPKLVDVELLLIVLFQETPNVQHNFFLRENILGRLQALGNEFIFGTHQEQVNLIKRLEGADPDVMGIKQQLNTASQVILISYDKLFELYEPYFKKTAIIKYISEHDLEVNSKKTVTYYLNTGTYNREIILRGMGLSSDCYGIKVNDMPRLSNMEAMNTIQQNDPDFVERILSCVGADNLDYLLRDNIIIPAYFSYDYKFAYFIALIAQHASIHQGKNIIVYHSGTNFNNFDEDIKTEVYIKYILDTFVGCQTLVYSPSSPEPNLQFGSPITTLPIVRVFSGFEISNQSYLALYQLAPLAGVSGDNTFELAIATKTLPVYWSTNAIYKELTLTGLIDVLESIKHLINEETLKQFVTFFKLCFDLEGDIQDYKDIDFDMLRTSWPIIADFIKHHRNFYDNLDEIICEELSDKDLPCALQDKTFDTSNSLNLLGFFSNIFDEPIVVNTGNFNPSNNQAGSV